MRSRFLGVSSPVTLLVIYASLIWPSMEGAKVCFLNQRSSPDNQCRNMVAIRRYSSRISVDCCNSSLNANGNLYYAITNSSIPFLQFLQARICMPCRRVTFACQNRNACPPGKVCKVRPNGKVKCVCSGCNQRPYQPVCGNDGVTYNNECELRRKACRDGRSEIDVAYNGICQKAGCDKVVCRKNGTCMLDQYTRPYCVQDCFRCPIQRADGPLCGADGVQYINSCHLRSEACKQGKAIGMAYKGKCIENASCDKINCGNKTCVQDASGRPRCVTCSTCDNSDPRRTPPTESECPENQPLELCGTNDKTYKDYNSLRKEMCKTRAFIEVKHLGACKGDPASQGSSSPLPPGDEPPIASPIQTSNNLDDIGEYYITLKHFVNILRKKYGLNITSPKYKELKPRKKIVFISLFIKSLKKHWRKIKHWP